VNFYDRFRLHIADLIKGKHFNSHLQRAVSKYGIENFTFEIWQEYPVDITFQMETIWILLLDATNKNVGYNIDKKAKTRLGATVSKSTKDKISKSLSGRKIAKDIVDRAQENNPRKKAIIVLNLNGQFLKEYSSINKAATDLGLLTTNVVAQLKGKSKTCGNYVFVYKSDYDPNKNYFTSKYKTTKQVGQYDKLTGKLIAIFANCKAAADSINGNQAPVHAVCSKYGKNKSYKGYNWKFIDQ
jgi:group I intron endonuclease